MQSPWGEKIEVLAGIWYNCRCVALWCNWLTRRPLKAESTGSIPVSATNLPWSSNRSSFLWNHFQQPIKLWKAGLLSGGVISMNLEKRFSSQLSNPSSPPGTSGLFSCSVSTIGSVSRLVHGRKGEPGREKASVAISEIGIHKRLFIPYLK